MLVPQIEGGLGPPGFETEKTSVKHLDASVTEFVPAASMERTLPTVRACSAVVPAAVSGPVITKVKKSSLN